MDVASLMDKGPSSAGPPCLDTNLFAYLTSLLLRFPSFIHFPFSPIVSCSVIAWTFAPEIDQLERKCFSRNAMYLIALLD
jgi:hypothetical protein